MRDPGGEFDGYLVDRPLGRGGQADVYLAHRPPDDAPVALKVLDTDHRSGVELTRLEREFSFARHFDHPHIIRVYAFRRHWLAMQYVDGGRVTDLPTLDQRLAALTQIADALDTVHHDGIVHCDVKPSNILVYKDFSTGGAVLTDFGVAHSLAEDMGRKLSRDLSSLSFDPAKRITHRRLERQTAVQASLPYAPPELLLGQTPSAAGDQYALACTAAELISGAPPFPVGTPEALIYAHVHDPPPRISQRRADLPPAMDTVLGRALAKDPEHRHDSCTEFLAALRHSLG